MHAHVLGVTYAKNRIVVTVVTAESDSMIGVDSHNLVGPTTPVTGRTAVLRWAEARERVLVVSGKPPRHKVEVSKVPTLTEFSNRFLEGYAKANRQKPSGISPKESFLRVHLGPLVGDSR